MTGIDENLIFRPLNIAILTISDTRSAADDRSGDELSSRIQVSGHRIADRAIVKDEKAAIQQAVKTWAEIPSIDAVITTGGTGLTGRDVTIEALSPLFDKTLDGFSVLFHQMSFKSVGLATLQSRATAGLAGTTYVFCLPGSTGAVRDAWEKILCEALDSRYRPCSLVDLIPRLSE